MDIHGRVIPHDTQRYSTTGDWQYVGGHLHVDVSKMPDERYEQLVMVHEIVEALLCKQHGIDEARVREFDQMYEAVRPLAGGSQEVWLAAKRHIEEEFGCDCAVTEISEPGDDPHAPYHYEHGLATSVERMLAVEAGVPWQTYEDANNALYADAQA